MPGNCSVESPSPATLQVLGQNGRSYLGQPHRLLLATVRDSTTYAYPRWKTVYGNGSRVEASSGVIELSPARYKSVLDALQPDLYSSLSDEITWEASKKRAATSVNRTLAWLDELLASSARPCNGEGGSRVLAPVTGGPYLEERRRSAAEAAKRDVAGFVLSGFGCGEEPAVRSEHLRAAVEELPEHLPRVLVGPACSPDEVLEAVCCGIDLFDTGYAVLATQGGYALTFSADGALPATSGPAAPRLPANLRKVPADGLQLAPAVVGADDTKINLWAEVYKRDAGPLLAGCQCFTCRNHSRAYVHHLLMSHEMLAQVLLELHNTHHCLRFFTAIRAALAEGTLIALRTRIMDSKQRCYQGPTPGPQPGASSV